MKRNFHLLIIAFIACSCGQQSKMQTQDGAMLLSPIGETQNVVDITPYVEALNIIPIKDTAGNFVADVSKMVIDGDGNMFIIGNMTPLTILKKDGTPHTPITQRGRGPREYIRIEDIALSEDKKELLLLDGVRVRCYKITDSLYYRR